MKYVYLLLSFLLILTGCSKDDKKDKIITVTIASEKRMGYVGGGTNQVAPYYLVKYPQSGTWRFFSLYIEGFDYEQGYEYVAEIRVHEDPIDPNMADQEIISYSLHKIISKEKKDSENLPDNDVPNTPEDEN